MPYSQIQCEFSACLPLPHLLKKKRHLLCMWGILAGYMFNCRLNIIRKKTQIQLHLSSLWKKIPTILLAKQTKIFVVTKHIHSIYQVLCIHP